ncbi:MAG: IS200/IS605 family transposase [Saprospiraceae bacterium]|nr:IS200/IS605 family transposase [Saprospiraceae bacterium]
MAHSKSKNWIHLIFSTKNRGPLITAEVEPAIHEQLRHQFIKMNCPVDTINGISDHVHILFLLHPQKALSDVVKQVKGASSHFVNHSDLMPYKFAWGVGYAAYSVSESGVPAVRKYIQNQKEHHRKRSFEEEYQAFLRLHGLENEDGNENG